MNAAPLRARSPIALAGPVRLVLALLAGLAGHIDAVAQEPATFKRIVVRVISRALDKSHPEVWSDTAWNCWDHVLGTDAPGWSDYRDGSLGRRVTGGAARELFVFYRPNARDAHLAIVSGAVTESGTKRTAYGIGAGDTPEEAEGRAVAHLRSRLPAWGASAAPHKVEERLRFGAGEARSDASSLKRRAVVHIAWKYVPEVGPSAQTELGFAVAYNADSRLAKELAGEWYSILPGYDYEELRERNLEELSRLGPYKEARAVSAELPLESVMSVVVVSARVPTAKGPVLQVFGAGIAPSKKEALEKALKNLAGRSWGWDRGKHGYREEYVREFGGGRLAAIGLRG